MSDTPNTSLSLKFVFLFFILTTGQKQPYLVHPLINSLPLALITLPEFISFKYFVFSRLTIFSGRAPNLCPYNRHCSQKQSLSRYLVLRGLHSEAIWLVAFCGFLVQPSGCEVERKLFLPATPLLCRVTCSKRHSWWWSECFHTVGSYRVDTM